MNVQFRDLNISLKSRAASEPEICETPFHYRLTGQQWNKTMTKDVSKLSLQHTSQRPYRWTCKPGDRLTSCGRGSVPWLRHRRAFAERHGAALRVEFYDLAGQVHCASSFLFLFSLYFLLTRIPFSILLLRSFNVKRHNGLSIDWSLSDCPIGF